jgi:hypothetical protein
MFLTLKQLSKRKKKALARNSFVRTVNQKISSRNFPLVILSKMFLEEIIKLADVVLEEMFATSVASQMKITRIIAEAETAMAVVAVKNNKIKL